MKTKEEIIKYWSSLNYLDSTAMKDSEKYPEETAMLRETYTEALYLTCLAHEALSNKVKALNQVAKAKYEEMLHQIVYSRELQQLGDGKIRLVLNRVSMPEGFKPKLANYCDFQDGKETIEDCYVYVLVGNTLYTIGCQGDIRLTDPKDDMIELTNEQVILIQNGKFPLELITYSKYIIT